MRSEESSHQSPNWAGFKGYYSPRYTSVPDQLFDEHLAFLSGAELKVLLYIVRRTFGWKKDSDNISLNQLQKGIVTRGGERLDSGTGLSRSTLLTTLKALVEKNLIFVERRDSAERGNEATNYRLNVTLGEVSPAPLNPRSKIDLGGSEKRSSLVRKSTPQETKLQETREQKDGSNIREASTTNLSLERGQARSIGPQTSTQGPLAMLLQKRQLRRQKRYPEGRQRILAYIQDFAAEFNDDAPLSSSTSRAYNLWQRSGISIEAFTGLMFEARALTQEHSASVTKAASTGGSSVWGPAKNKMAYYFAILTQLADQQSPKSADTEASVGERGNGKSKVISLPVPTEDKREAPQNIVSEAPQASRKAGTEPTAPRVRPKGKTPPRRVVKGDKLWQAVREELDELGPAFQQWLDKAEGEEKDGRLVISVKDDLARAWIQSRLMPAIEQAVNTIGRSELQVQVTE